MNRSLKLILVCGSREFDDPELVSRGMEVAVMAVGGGPVAVVHGGCSRGAATGELREVSADMLADAWCRRRADLVREVRVRMADWERYKLAAGPRRNSEMLREQRPDLAVAFVRLGIPMAGTKDMLHGVEKLRIPYLVITR